jgi:hypothetical protein
LREETVSRYHWLIAACLIGVAASLAVVASTRSTKNGVPGAASPPEGGNSAPTDHPAPGGPLTIIYTTDTNGFLQTCGCSGGQVGGLAKRATLIRELQAGAGTVLLLDGGDLAGDLDRAEAVMDCLRLMRYEAVGVSGLDTKLGPDFFRSAFRRGLPLIACPMPEGNPDGVLTSRVVRRSDRAVAIVALGKVSVEQIVPALRDVLTSLRGKAELCVVFSPLTFAEERRVVQAEGVAGRIDLLVGLRDGPSREAQEVDGVTFVPAARYAEVGVVRVEPSGGSGRRFTHHFEVVTAGITPDQVVQDAVNAYYLRQARQLLESSLTPEADWQDTSYESANRCVDCHPKEVRLWKESGHGKAAWTLKQKDRLVADCLRCHSEMFRRTGKFHPTIPAAWHGVECASCHGDAVLHAALRTKESVIRSPGEEACRRCHDPENDPKFDYTTYLGKIRHW